MEYEFDRKENSSLIQQKRYDMRSRRIRTCQTELVKLQTRRTNELIELRTSSNYKLVK